MMTRFGCCEIPGLRAGPIALALLTSLLTPISSRALDVAGRCSVAFFASSTLHDFEGKAPCALLAIEPPDASAAYRARADVAVERIETGIAARDRKLREMFEVQRHPVITARFAKVDPGALRANRPGALAFQISIHGVERSVTPELSDWSEVPGERVRFRATFELSLAEFGLEAPVAIGFMRVDDRVRVAVDVDLTARAASSPPSRPHAALR